MILLNALYFVKYIMIRSKNIHAATLLWQIFITVFFSVICWVIYGKNAGVSAFLGGFSVIFASFFAIIVYLRNKDKLNAVAILTSLIVSELVKLAFVFMFLMLVFKHYKNLVPAALIANLILVVVLTGAVMNYKYKNNLF